MASEEYLYEVIIKLLSLQGFQIPAKSSKDKPIVSYVPRKYSEPETTWRMD
jgi:hypothetical protein